MLGGLLIPLPFSQNHKLAYPFFARAGLVLVVKQVNLSVTPSTKLAEHLSNEQLVVDDISRGRERHPIPAFSSATSDSLADLLGLDFAYITQCVLNEGVRILAGGPMRSSWPCPFSQDMKDTGTWSGAISTPGGDDTISVVYDHEGRLRNPAGVGDAIYECTLASSCGAECQNRLVPKGPTKGLQIFWCQETSGKHAKGWGVRCAHMIRKGSFICEYVGEYISDDEAESRGTRYDNQKMSRLMDCIGDGKDVVRMCIDATRYSNLGEVPLLELMSKISTHCFDADLKCDV